VFLTGGQPDGLIEVRLPEEAILMYEWPDAGSAARFHGNIRWSSRSTFVSCAPLSSAASVIAVSYVRFQP
jgi:hypothetical protein